MMPCHRASFFTATFTVAPWQRWDFDPTWWFGRQGCAAGLWCALVAPLWSDTVRWCLPTASICGGADAAVGCLGGAPSCTAKCASRQVARLLRHWWELCSAGPAALQGRSTTGSHLQLLGEGGRRPWDIPQGWQVHTQCRQCPEGQARRCDPPRSV